MSECNYCGKWIEPTCAYLAYGYPGSQWFLHSRCESSYWDERDHEASPECHEGVTLEDWRLMKGRPEMGGTKRDLKITVGDNQDYLLTMTCAICPEQYSVFFGSVQFGYLRLRSGEYTVSVPDHMGDVILREEAIGDGEFFAEERMGALRRGVKAIHEWRVAREQKVDTLHSHK